MPRAVAGGGAHHLLGRDFGGGGSELGRELEAIQVEAGLTRVDAAGAEGSKGLRDRHLDAACVFKRGEEEGLALVAAAVLLVVTKLVVEVAVDVSAERGGFALGSAGQDVAAFDEHIPFLPDPPPPVFGRKFLISFSLRRGNRAKSFLGKELGADSSVDWSWTCPFGIDQGKLSRPWFAQGANQGLTQANPPGRVLFSGMNSE